MSIQEPTQSENSQLTIGDVYEGDSLGDLMPSVIDVKATEIGSSCVLSAVDDPSNNQWMQSSVAYEIDDCL